MGFGAPFFIPSVRTRAPVASILSAKSSIPVRDTTSFSNLFRSIPEAILQSMVSAPAGPRVVMTCMTLIIFVLPQGRTVPADLLGGHSAIVNQCSGSQGPGTLNHLLVDFLIRFDHLCYIKLFARSARGSPSKPAPGFFFSHEKGHGAREIVDISRAHQHAFLAVFH